MISTYLLSKKVLDTLLDDIIFLNSAITIVNSIKGSDVYTSAYTNLTLRLKSLGVTERVNIIKSDGSFWYSNTRTPIDPELNKSLNDRPEIFLAISYAFGNPICNKKLYPEDLQSSICNGYTFANRVSSTFNKEDQYVAKTYKASSSPLSTDIFTIRISQVI